MIAINLYSAPSSIFEFLSSPTEVIYQSVIQVLQMHQPIKARPVITNQPGLIIYLELYQPIRDHFVFTATLLYM